MNLNEFPVTVSNLFYFGLNNVCRFSLFQRHLQFKEKIFSLSVMSVIINVFDNTNHIPIMLRLILFFDNFTYVNATANP